MSTITEPRRRSRHRTMVAAVVLAALAAGAAACGAPSTEDDQMHVYASFATLAYLVEEVAGDDVQVTNLTPAGTDPHSQELSPANVAALADADLVVYASGLQDSVDDAIAAAEPAHVVDTLDAATAEVDGAAHTPPDPSRDPHFWLDPVRFGLAAEQVAQALADLDPENAAAYADRADALVAELTALDDEHREALDRCAGSTLVTSHEAFGYLAARYDLRQEGIAGIDPEVEPSPARIRDLREVIEQTGVTTIFFEQAADPGVAQTLADDLGVSTAVLDPMERTEDLDYPAVMRANLAALTTGLVCAG